VADDFREFLEIWTSDGSIGAQPRLIREIPDVGFARPVSGLGDALGDKLVFDITIGLWVTDGTREGTVPLIQDGSGPSTAGTALVADSLYVLFGKTLWRTDGTVEGTAEIETFSGLSNPELLTAVGPSLLLRDRSEAGPILWRYDLGAGTLEEVAPGWRMRGYAGTPLVLGTEAYFVAAAPGQAEELWRVGVDGESRRLTDFTAPQPFQRNLSSQIVASNGEILMIAAEAGIPGLYSLGDDPASTRSKDVCNRRGRCFSLNFNSPLFAVDGGVLFSSPAPLCDEDVVFTDGTAAGTKSFADQMVGFCSSTFSASIQEGSPLQMRPVHVFAQHPSGRSRVCRFSGASVACSDLQGAPRFGERPLGRWLTPLGHSLILRLEENGPGQAPWLSPLSGDAYRLADLDPHRIGAPISDVASVGDQVLFLIIVPTGGGTTLQLWASAGDGRQILAQGAFAPNLKGKALGKAFFSETRAQGVALRATDGTAAGTGIVHQFSEAGFLGPVMELGGRGFFLWSGDTAAPELWSTDGVSAEKIQTLVDPAFPASPEPFPGESWVVDDRLYFTTTLSGSLFSEHRLWVTDGTASGTELLSNFGTIDQLHGAVPTAEGVLFLVEARNSLGERLISVWSTDGTASGTRRAVEQTFRLRGGSPTNLVSFGGEGLFYANGLWATDGTDVGTRLLSQGSSQPACRTKLVVADDRAYLPFPAEGQGCELVMTDGTVDGTRVVADLWLGREGAYPEQLTVVEDRLYFVATTPGHGSELRVTDGTAEGTRLVHDLWPGAESSSVSFIRRAGSRLVFRADDGLSGGELWTLPLEGGAVCQEGETAFCLNQGRFLVESRWEDFQGRRGEGKAVRLTQDTGYFWFFNPQNVELMLKVLDGRENNEHYWTFFGALSNVEYWITVTDTANGLTRRYFNPSRNFASIGDTRSFGPLGASLAGSPSAEPLSSVGSSASRSQSASVGVEACEPSETRLCLNGGRFAAEVSWTDFQGNVGVGTAEALTDDTGTFWFFNRENLELVVKVLDGVSVNAHYWVFYGSLSNVDFDLTLTDTENGEVQVYRNRNRTFASAGDTRAFFFR